MVAAAAGAAIGMLVESVAVEGHLVSIALTHSCSLRGGGGGRGRSRRSKRKRRRRGVE